MLLCPVYTWGDAVSTGWEAVGQAWRPDLSDLGIGCHYLAGHCCRSSSRRFLVYGRYCSQVESASKHLDRVASAREDVQMKLEVGVRPHLGGFPTPSRVLGTTGRTLSCWHCFLRQPSQGSWGGEVLEQEGEDGRPEPWSRPNPDSG